MPLVLVVEDRPTDRELLVDLLDNSGYELLESETAEEAVRLALEWKPDLVIADMLVPEMDGLDLTRAVRANPAIAQTPIMLRRGRRTLGARTLGSCGGGIAGPSGSPRTPGKSSVPWRRWSMAPQRPREP